MRHTIPVSLAYKFAFMLSFVVAVFMISGCGEFQLSCFKSVWVVGKLRVVVWTHTFILGEERKKSSAFLENFLSSSFPVLFSKMINHFWPIAWLLHDYYNKTIRTCGTAAVLCPSKCVRESFLCDYSLFRITLWFINGINSGNNIGPWFDYTNKIICTWSQKCFIKYLHILLRRTRMYSYFMKFMLCF